METKAVLKSWGSSLGVVVPAEIVKKEHLKEGDEIRLEIKKKESIKAAFGALKDWKIDPQKAKDELRKGWAR